MAWIELHQTLREHKKLFSCADQLGLSRIEMIGTLVCLWLWALDNAPDGCLEGISEKTLARVCDFPEKRSGKLVEALRTSGFLDADSQRNCLIIHDWYDYAGKLMERREKDKKRKEQIRKKAVVPADEPEEVPPLSAGLPADNPGKSHATVPNRTVPNPSTYSGKKELDGCDAPLSGKSFTIFWEAYPNKESRSAAWEAWKELSPDGETQGAIMAGLEAWKQSGRWLDDDGRYIPHAAKWLRERRWQCPPSPKKQPVPKGASGSLGAAEMEAIRHALAQPDYDLPPLCEP